MALALSTLPSASGRVVITVANTINKNVPITNQAELNEII